MFRHLVAATLFRSLLRLFRSSSSAVRPLLGFGCRPDNRFNGRLLFAFDLLIWSTINEAAVGASRGALQVITVDVSLLIGTV